MIYIANATYRPKLMGTVIYVGRATSYDNAVARCGKLINMSFLGNPFHMTGESQRNYVCNRYEKEVWPRLLVQYKDILDRLKAYQKDKVVSLVCWCAPKRCHADTIKQWLEE